MATAVNINLDNLSLAREQLNLSIDVAAKKLGYVDSSALEAVEAGERTITFKKLRSAAKIYGVPFAYFYLNELPDKSLDIADFRINPEFYGKPLPSQLIKALRESISHRETIVELYAELQDELPAFNMLCSIEDDPETVGKVIRETFPNNLMTNKSELIKRTMLLFESYGIYVNQIGGAKHTKVDYEEFDGAAFYYDTLPMIVLNSDVQSKNKMMFTLFHELTHLMLKQSAITDFFNDIEYAQSRDIATIETFCNKVAAAALVPNDGLLKSFDGENISELADTFRVSREVIAIRLRNLRAITQSRCDELLKQYKQEFVQAEKRKSARRNADPVVNPNLIRKRNLGALYIDIVREAYSQNKVSYFDTLSYLGMREKAARKIIYE